MSKLRPSLYSPDKEIETDGDVKSMLQPIYQILSTSLLVLTFLCLIGICIVSESTRTFRFQTKTQKQNRKQK